MLEQTIAVHPLGGPALTPTIINLVYRHASPEDTPAKMLVEPYCGNGDS